MTVACPFELSASGWPLNMTTRLVIGATLLAIALMITCWPGIAGKLGVSTICHAGKLRLAPPPGSGCSESTCLPVRDLQCDDEGPRLRGPGRPLEQARLWVDRRADSAS